MFDMWGDNAPVDPADFDDEAELQAARSTWPRGAEVAVVVVGEWQNMIGEAASRSSLELPGRQLELLQAVVATGTPTVAVVMNGRPLDLRWAAEHVPAILDVWYPGSPGRRGRGEPAVRRRRARRQAALHLAAHRRAGADGLRAHRPRTSRSNQGRRYWDEESTPLFPFGHGLCYAPLRVRRPDPRRARGRADGTVTVSVEVTNTGDRDADEVVQLYLHQRHGTRVASGARAQGLRAGGARRRGVADGDVRGRPGRAPLLERRRAATGCSTPRRFDVWVGGELDGGADARRSRSPPRAPARKRVVGR